MNIYRSMIERIVIIWNSDDAEMIKAFDYCDKNGFTVEHIGLKKIGKRTFDHSKMRIVATRKHVCKEK